MRDDGIEDVRRATLADLDALVPLVAGFRDHLELDFPATDRIAASLVTLIDDRNTEILVSPGAQKRLVGYAALRFRYSLWVDASEAQIDDLYVSPDARRLGIGTRLVHGSIAAARARGAKLIGLNTNERNANALRRYLAAGFSAKRARWNDARQLWLEMDL
jgi:ribosomal protein S18 acetylase RimI-like enzyme